MRDVDGAAAPVDFAAHGLRVRHPGSPAARFALDDFSVEVRRGEQVAIIGASGAGKSTALATLALAREPADGRLDVFGVAPWTMASAARHRLRRRLFLAPQTPPLPPRQRVVDAVLAGLLPRWSLAAAIGSLVRPKDAGLARDALRRFALDDKLFERVDRLSGGERQRAALARMLVADVDAYFVDEPLSALDPTLASRALAVLQDAARERGATLVCSLHQVELARASFPRLVGLRAGRVVFDLPSARVDASMLEALYASTHEGRTSSGASDLIATDDAHGEPERIADGARL